MIIDQAIGSRKPIPITESITRTNAADERGKKKNQTSANW